MSCRSSRLFWLNSRFFLAALIPMMTVGCSLPAAGPTSRQIENTTGPALDTYLVRVTPAVMAEFSKYPSRGFPPTFQFDNYRPSVALKPGDIITVNIYESGGTPLFAAGGRAAAAPAPGDASQQPPLAAPGASLPAQVVEPDGMVTVPFVGRIRVAGLSPSQAAEGIRHSLEGKTVTPQVIVSLTNNVTNAVSVGGEVNRAGLVPLTLRGERLLDVIAQAGGPRFPATQVDVRVMRGRNVATVPLQQVLGSPSDNISIRPDDNVVLVRNPRTFVVLGAVTKVAQYEMETERVTLAEGVARAGGTIDTIGSLAGIYVLRREPTAFARAVLGAARGSTDDRFVQTEETRSLASSETNVVYQVNLTETGGYFYAQNLVLRDKDIVLVANADTTQLQKILAIMGGFTRLYFDVSRGIYVPN